MGSAEQEIILDSIQLLVPRDEATPTVSVAVSDLLEDKKNVEDDGVSVVPELPLEKSSQTVMNHENFISAIDKSTESKSPSQKSDEVGNSVASPLKLKGDMSHNVELQNSVDQVPECSKDNAVRSCSDTSRPNCDASQLRNDVQSVDNVSGFTDYTAKESGLVVNSNIQTRTDEITFSDYPQRPTVPRKFGSNGHSRTVDESASTYNWTAVVPAPNDQPYNFRYNSLLLLTVTLLYWEQ